MEVTGACCGFSTGETQKNFKMKQSEPEMNQNGSRSCWTLSVIIKWILKDTTHDQLLLKLDLMNVEPCVQVLTNIFWSDLSHIFLDEQSTLIIKRSEALSSLLSELYRVQLKLNNNPWYHFKKLVWH